MVTMSGRNIRRKQVKEAKLKTKKYRNELVKSGVPVKDVDKIIEDNPDIVTDVISYNDVLKVYFADGQCGYRQVDRGC